MSEEDQIQSQGNDQGQSQAKDQGQNQGQGQQNFGQYYNPSNFQNYQGYVPQGGYQAYGQQAGGYQGYAQYNQQAGGYQGYQGYQQYNPAQAGYQGYQQYNAQGGYQSYKQYNSQPQGNRKGNQSYGYGQGQSATAPVTLNNFEKGTVPNATAPKPKKTLKLASSSGIKLVGAKKPVAKKEEAKAEEPTKEEPKSSAEGAPKSEDATASSEDKAVPSIEKLSISEADTAKKDTADAAGATSSDALIKEQEDEVDEEVVKDMFGGKDHVSIIFMGHVDAGKSTMGGNLLYLTGSVDKRTVEKYEKEAKEAGRQGWYLSWIMDTNKEERNDGKTIEVGRSYFETEKRRYTILDAPGHKMYVSEMIGGASQADVGILVISARKGEYETGFERGGQTREHALLAKTQGVNKMVVVVNKMDDPTVNWDKARYDQCIKNVSNFLQAIGYNVKEDVMYMPVSGFTGAGLKDRVDKKDCPWYDGPSLLEYLDNMQHVDRFINAPFMLPIASKMKDMGTVVEGKIESGHIKKGNQTLLMPNKIPVEILAIQNETEQEVDMAVCGEQVRLRLKGVEEEDISAGFVLTSPKNPVKNVTKFVAQIAIVELKSIMSAGFSCVMHVHTAIEEVSITRLLHKLEKGTNRKSKKPPAFAKKGMKIIAVLETEEPVCVETYQDYPHLGRFTLRDQGITIAIGKIVKILE
ncbi:AGL145Wp [Eremothecium gossypii ATCC 10895]|uniref:Eukaryotic peptide chain release factor GTP-binding subunit n=1 Tax=Eremothecium gossypii (strain ATCC 10895 / CBS 109.51 / FGSC 9923 / NRRL Y-1056) TaxID=284811 RepID=Q750T4_EREGS|nr:AGL145Wp [Eremothecium gossypii ATCC 10895]AAS54346.2 AGL145Wp [Eremothecium gossypii ATCC 10895]AEY98673.1 FAGL145Wp [Eremothecium gossypii FDAG1]